MTAPQPPFPQPVVHEDSAGIYTFCPYRTAKPPLRCIGSLGHERLAVHTSGHDLQPLSSVSVRAIERQEEPLERLGYPRPTWPSTEPAKPTEPTTA